MQWPVVDPLPIMPPMLIPAMEARSWERVIGIVSGPVGTVKEGK